MSIPLDYKMSVGDGGVRFHWRMLPLWADMCEVSDGCTELSGFKFPWSVLHCLWTHWGMDKMDKTWQKAFSKAFLKWKYLYLYWSIIYFILSGPIDNKSVSVQGDGLAPSRWQTITWTKVNVDTWCHMTLGLFEFSEFGQVIMPYDFMDLLWALLLTWFNFNPSMDK